MRVRPNRPVVLSHSFTDDNEAPLEISGVRVRITDLFGSTAVELPAVLVDGRWTITVTLQALGPYTATWTANTGAVDTTAVEATGAALVSLREIRAADRVLADTSKYPAALLAGARDATEAEFERITGRSFTPRVTRHVAYGTGGPFLLAPHSDLGELVSAYIDGQPPASPVLLHPFGVVEYPPGWPDGARVELVYRYGWTVAPEDVCGAAALRVRDRVLARSSGIPDRATSYQPTEGGTFTIATPGRAGAETGIPDVDAVLARYVRRVGVIPNV